MSPSRSKAKSGLARGAQDDEQIGRQPDGSAHAEEIAVRQLGAEHRQREQEGAKQKPPRRVDQELAGKEEEERGYGDADRQRIDDEAGIAP